MSNDRYNYSVSLIRRSSDTWMIEPEDASAQAFYYELLGKGLGDHYLATKTQGELSYCVFLSGDVCHADVYGWMITLNGWRLLDIDTYLQLSQQIWEEFALVSSRGDIRQILHGLIDEKRLVSHSTPAPIDRNVEHSYHALTFTPKSKPRVRLDTTQGSSGNKSRGFGHVGIFMFVISLIVVFIFAAFLPRGGSSDSLGAIAQSYYEKKQEVELTKYEAEMEKQIEEQYGENKKKGAEFIANYKKEAGVKTTASGLAYQVLKEGNGATPKATDMVQVNYVGKLIDGTVFDESKGTPAEFRLDQVIEGWTEMLQLMKVGEKVKVVIPEELAGARVIGEKIPPFSTLVFEIELLKVSAAGAAQPDSL